MLLPGTEIVFMFGTAECVKATITEIVDVGMDDTIVNVKFNDTESVRTHRYQLHDNGSMLTPSIFSGWKRSQELVGVA